VCEWFTIGDLNRWKCEVVVVVMNSEIWDTLFEINFRRTRFPTRLFANKNFVSRLRWFLNIAQHLIWKFKLRMKSWNCIHIVYCSFYLSMSNKKKTTMMISNVDRLLFCSDDEMRMCHACLSCRGNSLGCLETILESEILLLGVFLKLVSRVLSVCVTVFTRLWFDHSTCSMYSIRYNHINHFQLS